jgi:two-component system sensor histidine kinase BaeS
VHESEQKVTRKLSVKICASFLLTFFVVLVVMIGSIRFFAYQNFSGYVHKVELDMLGDFVDRMIVEYENRGGWESLRGRYWELYRILNPRQAIKDAEKEQAGGADDATKEPDITRIRYVMRMASRLTLFDVDKNVIAGRARTSEGHTLRRIEVEGKMVGWLGLKKEARPSHPLDIAYLREQTKVFYLVGAGVLCLSAIMSFFLSKNLLAPIKQLTAGTRALTSFKFDTRIVVHTKDELGQLAADFNVMAKTLEKSKEMQQQWITDVSHELRTPLSILRGEIEAMQDGVREPNRENLDSIHSEVIYLSNIVNDLHDLSLAETGELPLTRAPVKPIRVLRETLILFKHRFEEKNITVLDQLGVDDSTLIEGDADRLTQLFSNLFENVLRYSEKPGKLRIWHKRDESRMKLYIEDSGPGVPEDAIERLFDRFYRVDPARTRARGGSGLGLSICKKIVEVHGGQIEAMNSPSGGLRFEIAFPV